MKVRVFRVFSRLVKNIHSSYSSSSSVRTTTTTVAAAPFSTFKRSVVIDRDTRPYLVPSAVASRRFITGRRLRSPVTSATSRLRTMRLDNAAFHALFDDELKVLIAVFEKHNYELRIAGGAVRDLLSGVHCDDLDFATTATPDQMLALFELEGIRTLNRRGEKHGTVTCRINDKENYEVTTLRIDVVTDGRHAEVEFTQDWQLDALRRDLTINSMFLGFDGTVYDYHHGIDDLKAKVVRFVGDPTSRIQEDYLRILRYFRFYGRIAEQNVKQSEDTLKCIQDNMQGLEGISGERIWLELRKIFVGRLGNELINIIIRLGMTKYLGLPESPDHEVFDEVYKISDGLAPAAITLTTSLLKNIKDMEVLHKRLKFSNNELNIGLFIIAYRDKVAEADDLLKWAKEHLTYNAGKDIKLQEKLLEFLKYKGSNMEDIDTFNAFRPPQFPLNGHQLIEAGVPKGRIMSKVLEELRSRWKDGDFKADKSSLIELIPDIVIELRQNSNVK